MKLLTCFVCVHVIVLSVQCEIVIKDNKYDGIVVAIGKHVKEDPGLVENIKELFVNGSHGLYKATKMRAAFGLVTIAVPSTWTRRDEYEEVINQGWFESAHIRVDNPHPLHGDVPYTVQPGNCGDPGVYVHFTPAFIKAKNETKFGPLGRVLVHEWAHLRYGVFDEYGSPGTRFPMIYLTEDAKLRLNGCPKELKGWMLNPDGTFCTKDAEGRLSSRCRFFVDKSDSGSSSLMSISFLDKADEFCDDSTNQTKLSHSVVHNSDAPNLHNEKCKGKSIWKVISSHPDFSNHSNLPNDKLDTKPRFRVIWSPPKSSSPYIFLIDSSISMLSKRQEKTKQALVRLIEFIPDGVLVGLTKFSNTSTLLHNITSLNEEVKSTMKQKIWDSLNATDGTALGQSLEDAAEIFGQSGYPEGNIIVFTDGKETDNSENKTQLLIDKRIKVYPVFFSGTNFSSTQFKKMENLAKRTGGAIHGGKVKIRSNLERIVADILNKNSDSENPFIQVIPEYAFITNSKPLEKTVHFDSYSSGAVTFMFHFLNATAVDSLDVRITSPSSKVYSLKSSSTILRVYNDTGTVSFGILPWEPGMWQYRVQLLNEPPNSTVHVSVHVILTNIEAKPTNYDKEEGLRVRTWTSSSNIETPKATRILTSVSWGYNPVVNASVQAKIERPNGTVWEELKDDGVGADNVANDGVYSVDFVQYSAIGVYSIDTVVKSTNYTYYLDTGTLPGSRVMEDLPLPPDTKLGEPSTSFDFETLEVKDDSSTEVSLKKVKMESFERSTLAGSFQLETYDANFDQIPPSAVTDLQVNINWIVSTGNRILASLEWTSAGDDALYGIAKEIQLRYSTESVFTSNFRLGYLVEDKHVKDGSLVPKHGGSKHYVTIDISSLEKFSEKKENLVYFAVVTVDDMDNIADPSNYVRVYIPAKLLEQGLTTGTIALLAVLVLIALIVIAVVILRFLNYRSQKAANCHHSENHSKSNSQRSAPSSAIHSFQMNMYSSSSASAPLPYTALPTDSQENITQL